MKRLAINSSILLAGLSASALTTGCSSIFRSSAPAPVMAPVAVAPVRPTTAPSINVFGELDGMAPRVGGTAPDSALTQHTFLTEGSDADAAISPDGQWMVFTSTRHSPHPKIYLQRVDGVTVTQLTTDDADDANPTFSPDGKHIAFSSNRSGNWSIYTIETGGTNTVQVTNSRTHDLHPSFSPDGTQIVYSSLGARSGQWELWVVDLATSSRKMVGEGLFPVWSPAKGLNKIAFQKARQRGSRQYSIWTIDLENGEPRRPTEVAVAANAALVTPTWSPDGKHLAFASLVQVGTGTQHDVWIIDGDGRNRRRVTDGVGVALSPTWSTTGSLYFISDRGGNETIWSVAPAMADAPVAKANPTPETPAPAAAPSEAQATVEVK